jgi:urease accessory protein
MVRDEVLGNLSDFPVANRRLERIPVHSDDCAKRLLRLSTSLGEIGLRFSGPRRLRDGDVIHADERVVIAVRVLPDDVLIGHPGTIASALALGHALGNRHLPVQIDGGEVVVRYDPLLPALFAEHDVPVTRATRVVPEPFRHAQAPHGHE